MKGLAIVAVLALAGCATDVMESFVGKDVTAAVGQYGPPANTYDLPDGRRAFQWRMDGVAVMPTTTTYTAYGNVGTAFTSGGSMIATSCFYTLYGKKAPGGGYTIVGFEQPRLDCM